MPFVPTGSDDQFDDGLLTSMLPQIHVEQSPAKVAAPTFSFPASQIDNLF